MDLMPFVHRITIFPVKSLDGESIKEVQIAKGGCLLHDREFAFSDENGNFIIGKSNPLVFVLRSKVDFKKEEISFRHQDTPVWNTFHLYHERDLIESFLSNHFGIPIRFHQEKTGRFLDIPDISGITLLSKASLQSITSWFEPLTLDETRKRFRASIEIDGVPAFWEDRLFGEPGSIIVFRIGDVKVGGMSPRARCTVPPRNPENGTILTGFQKVFTNKRAESVPAWSVLKNYGHHYHLSVDCHLPDSETGKFIRVGDEIQILEKRTS